ncbi:LCP family protein [Cellulomonas composti]|uniref:Transcriptional regulator n=1 Tax=Cellulomonas composti TaxID=266130 RepID=A0A511J8H5_9CELL|nr:LCP family protein [Cellulomonas composti]GEL94023.1 transcriptional regulator [Cellulomonas composti]
MSSPRHSRDLQEDGAAAAVARHARGPSRRRRGWRVAGLVVVGALAFSCAAVATAAHRLRGSMEVADVDRYLAGPRPTSTTGAGAPVLPSDGFGGRAVNVLVVGTDMRDGENEQIGGPVGGMHNDTTMVVHVSADRTRVSVVSIPRDSLVDIPACLRPDGTSSTAVRAHIFNDALWFGGGPTEDLASGAACVIRTVEQSTGVLIDASVVVKMDGVAAVIDELDGLDLCLPERMESPKAGHLVLDAGWNHLDGRTAIQFLRARTGKGNGLELGSDLARIARQQQMIDALGAQVRSEDLLRDPVELLRVLDAVARSLSVSPALADPRTVLGLAYSLRDLDVIERVMVPVTEARQNRNRVVWTTAADQLWARLLADEPLTDRPTASPRPRPRASGPTVRATPTDRATPTVRATPSPGTTTAPTCG